MITPHKKYGVGVRCSPEPRGVPRTADFSKCGSANRNAKHFARQVCLDEPCVWEQLHDFSKRKMQKGIPPVFFEKSKVFR